MPVSLLVGDVENVELNRFAVDFKAVCKHCLFFAFSAHPIFLLGGTSPNAEQRPLAAIWFSVIIPAKIAFVPSAIERTLKSGWNRGGPNFCRLSTSMWSSPCQRSCGEVTFRYKEEKRKKKRVSRWRTMTLPAMEFIIFLNYLKVYIQPGNHTFHD
jgi:hypothetical protein